MAARSKLRSGDTSPRSGRFDPDLPVAADTLEQAARKVLGSLLLRVREHDPATRLGDDPEALHRMRVAVRQLRAATRVFEKGMSGSLHEYFARELKWVGHCLGRVRDLDVQMLRLKHTARLAEVSDRRVALGVLEEFCSAERIEWRIELLSALDSARYVDLLARIDRFAHGAPRRQSRGAEAGEPLATAARDRVKAAVSKLLARGRKIQQRGAAPSAKSLHALRIRTKRLRYLLEFLANLTGKPGRRLVKRLIRLQDLLGAHQDAVVASELIRSCVERGRARTSRNTTRVLFKLIDAEERTAAEARAKIAKSWRRFSGKRMQAERRAVMGRLRAQERTGRTAHRGSQMGARNRDLSPDRAKEP